jgi:plasmid stabilization system protein ParE
MSRSLRILERAQTDVDDIFRWILSRSVKGAVAWQLAFYGAVENIATSPDACGTAPEAIPTGRNLRQQFFKTRRGRIYRVVFELTSEEIVLLRVRGPGQSRLGRRDLPEN